MVDFQYTTVHRECRGIGRYDQGEQAYKIVVAAVKLYSKLEVSNARDVVLKAKALGIDSITKNAGVIWPHVLLYAGNLS